MELFFPRGEIAMLPDSLRSSLQDNPAHGLMDLDGHPPRGVIDLDGLPSPTASSPQAVMATNVSSVNG